MKRLLFLFTCMTLFYQPGIASDTTRVLFIGNSFIYTYDVPALTKGLAIAAGHHFEYAQHTPGGITVGDISQGNQAHMYNPTVFNLIRQGNWDFVVLQDNQGRFVLNYGTFPASSKVIEGHKKIRDSVKHYSPCASMLWFAGWAFKNGSPPYGNTGAEMIDRIYANYSYLNDTIPEIISPIGLAWNRAMIEVPSTDLWGPDGAHQSLAGSYLTASVLFTSIYRKNITGVDYRGGLDSTTARIYRRIAYETTVDSLVPTNLASLAPSLSYSGGMLTASSGFAGYQWYKDSVLLSSGPSNTFQPGSTGCFQVTVTDNTGCTFRSMELCVGTTSVNDVSAKGAFNAYPNPCNGKLKIETASNGNKRLTIRNLTGQIVYRTAFSSPELIIDIDHLTAGVYFLTLEDGRKHSVQKIIRQ